MSPDAKSPKLNQAEQLLELAKKSRPGHLPGPSQPPTNPPGKP